MVRDRAHVRNRSVERLRITRESLARSRSELATLKGPLMQLQIAAIDFQPFEFNLAAGEWNEDAERRWRRFEEACDKLKNALIDLGDPSSMKLQLSYLKRVATPSFAIPDTDPNRMQTAIRARILKRPPARQRFMSASEAVYRTAVQLSLATHKRPESERLRSLWWRRLKDLTRFDLEFLTDAAEREHELAIGELLTDTELKVLAAVAKCCEGDLDHRVKATAIERELNLKRSFVQEQLLRLRHVGALTYEKPYYRPNDKTRRLLDV